MRSAVIVGTGMIGTSVGLALRERGVAVRLVDRDPDAARLAEARGAGCAAPRSGPADVAVLGVPPTQVAAVLREAQARGLAHSYTDVASVKARPLAEAEAMGCDLATYVGGHPLAGSEKSGPSAASATLFEGRPWVLTPTEDSTTAATERAFEVVALCGARPVVMDHEDHDRALALISHTPHLAASVMAAQLERLPPDILRLCGAGMRDFTRIAAGSATLWGDIIGLNAPHVADALCAVIEELRSVVAALRGLSDLDEHGRLECGVVLEDVLVRGIKGRTRMLTAHDITSADRSVTGGGTAPIPVGSGGRAHG